MWGGGLEEAREGIVVRGRERVETEESGELLCGSMDKKVWEDVRGRVRG